MNLRIALDSNIATYFVEANFLEYNPNNDNWDSAKERVATVRIYLYSNLTFGLTPTAIQQIEKISNNMRLEEHTATISNIFEDFPFEFAETMIEERKNYYFGFHKGGKKQEEDCRILAEAEIGDQRFGNYDVLLTFDKNFIKNLKDKTKTLKLMSPSDFWKGLNIPKGSEPIKWFHTTNPNRNKTWWKW